MQFEVRTTFLLFSAPAAVPLAAATALFFLPEKSGINQSRIAPYFCVNPPSPLSSNTAGASLLISIPEALSLRIF
jgi:hypothetical protein